jgi:hypothetical protein
MRDLEILGKCFFKSLEQRYSTLKAVKHQVISPQPMRIFKRLHLSLSLKVNSEQSVTSGLSTDSGKVKKELENALCPLRHLKSVQNYLLVFSMWSKPLLGRKMEYHEASL